MEQKSISDTLTEAGFFYDTEAQQHVFVAPNTSVRYSEDTGVVKVRVGNTEYSAEMVLTKHPAFEHRAKTEGIMAAINGLVESMGGKPI
jgi:hypothetical protein